MDYFKTKLGKLKLATVVAGLFAMAFTAASFDNAPYYHSTCDPTIQVVIDTEDSADYRQLTRHHRSSRHYLDHALSSKSSKLNSPSCAQLTPNTEANCQYMNDVNTELAQNGHPKMKACPLSWLVILPLIVIALTWAISLVLLITFFVVDLNLKMASFSKLDYVGHLIAGGLLLLMAFCTGIFLFWVLIGDYPCVEDGYESRQTNEIENDQVLEEASDEDIFSPADYESYRRRREEKRSHSLRDVVLVEYNPPPMIYGDRFEYFDFYFDHEILKRSEYRTCRQHMNKVYQYWLLLLGTIFTVGTGILYVFTGVVIIQQGAPTAAVAPMKVVGQEENGQPPLEQSKADVDQNQEP